VFLRFVIVFDDVKLSRNEGPDQALKCLILLVFQRISLRKNAGSGA